MNRPRVLFLIDAEQSLSFGRASYVHDLIHRAGGSSVTNNLAGEGTVISQEFILTAQPDVIFMTGSWDDPTAALLAHQPEWDLLPAVQLQQVFTLEPSLIYRPGPRLVEGVYQMASYLRSLNMNEAH